tara:strand:- start:316 stop:570 length:255 start_codon:yes stop_codon:yes gene_type:complete
MRHETRIYKDKEVGQTQLLKLKTYDYIIDQMTTKEVRDRLANELSRQDAKKNQYHFRSKALNTYKVPLKVYEKHVKEVEAYFAA